MKRAIKSVVLLVQATDYVEHKSAVGDGFAEVTKIASHLLEMAAKISDVKITLDKVPELGIEEEHSCLPIPKELGLDRDPGLTRCRVELKDSVHEVGGDRPGDPRADNAVHVCPVGVGSNGCIAKDMVLKGILPNCKKDLLVPPHVGIGVDVEDDVD